MKIAALILGWLLCAVASYLLVRQAWRKDRKWTIGDRNFYGSLSLIGGPAALVASIIMYLALASADRESKW